MASPVENRTARLGSTNGVSSTPHTPNDGIRMKPVYSVASPTSVDDPVYCLARDDGPVYAMANPNRSDSEYKAVRPRRSRMDRSTTHSLCEDDCDDVEGIYASATHFNTTSRKIKDNDSDDNGEDDNENEEDIYSVADLDDLVTSPPAKSASINHTHDHDNRDTDVYALANGSDNIVSESSRSHVRTSAAGATTVEEKGVGGQ